MRSDLKTKLPYTILALFRLLQFTEFVVCLGKVVIHHRESSTTLHPSVLEIFSMDPTFQIDLDNTLLLLEERFRAFDRLLQV